MRRLSRRQFAGSVGAGLLLAPFINMATRRQAQAATKQSKRILLFCYDGDEAAAVDADRNLGRDDHHLERDDPAAVGGEGERRPRRGDAERQPERRPRRLRQPHRPGVRLLRPGRHQELRRSVRRQEAGRRRDQPPDRRRCCWAPTPTTAAASRSSTAARTAATCRPSARRCRRSTPCSAAALPDGDVGLGAARASARASSTPSRPRSTALKATLGSNEKAKLDAHLDSIRQLENKLQRQPCRAGRRAARSRATPGADSALAVHGRPGRAARRTRSTRASSSTPSPATSPASPASSTATTRS